MPGTKQLPDSRPTLPLAGLRQRLGAIAIAAVFLCASPSWADFTVNGNGTVTDSATELVWDQCPLGLSDAGCSTGSVTQLTWKAALATAVTANAANYKGFSDWRLPNIKELESLVKIDASRPAIDSTAFPNTPTIVTLSFFSSSAQVYPVTIPVAPTIYGMNFEYGRSFFWRDVAASPGAVRLVRAGRLYDSYDVVAADIVFANGFD